MADPLAPLRALSRLRLAPIADIRGNPLLQRRFRRLSDLAVRVESAIRGIADLGQAALTSFDL